MHLEDLFALATHLLSDSIQLRRVLQFDVGGHAHEAHMYQHAAVVRAAQHQILVLVVILRIGHDAQSDEKAVGDRLQHVRGHVRPLRAHQAQRRSLQRVSRAAHTKTELIETKLNAAQSQPQRQSALVRAASACPLVRACAHVLTLPRPNFLNARPLPRLHAPSSMRMRCTSELK